MNAREDAPCVDDDRARRHGLAGRDLVRAARSEVWEKTLSLMDHTIRA